MKPCENESEVKITMIPEENEEISIDTKNLNRLSVPDLLQNNKKDDSTIQKNERSKSLDPTHKIDGFNALRNRIPSILSLSELSGDVVMKTDQTQNGKWYSYSNHS